MKLRERIEDRRWKRLIKKIRSKLPGDNIILSDNLIKKKCMDVKRYYDRFNITLTKEILIRDVSDLIRFSRVPRVPILNQASFYNLDSMSVGFRCETPESVMDRIEVFNNDSGFRAELEQHPMVGDPPEEVGRVMEHIEINNNDIWRYNPTILKRCPVCATTLDNYDSFPDWYPEKWRVCCYCHDAYKLHYKLKDGYVFSQLDERRNQLTNHYKRHEEELEKRFGIQ